MLSLAAAGYTRPPPYRGTSLIKAAAAGIYNAFCGACELDNGWLGTPYRAGATHADGAGILAWQASASGGKLWLDQVTLYDHPSLDCRDPEVLVLPDKRLLFQFFLTPSGSETVWIMFGRHIGAGIVTVEAPIQVPNVFTGANACSSRPVQINADTVGLYVYGKNTGQDFWSSAFVKLTLSTMTFGTPIIVAQGSSGHDFTETNGVIVPSTGKLCSVIRKDGVGFYTAYSTSAAITAFAATTLVKAVGDNGPGKPCIVLLDNQEILLVGRFGGPTSYLVTTGVRTVWPEPTRIGPLGSLDEYCSAVKRRNGSIAVVRCCEETPAGEGSGSRIDFHHFSGAGVPA